MMSPQPAQPAQPARATRLSEAVQATLYSVRSQLSNLSFMNGLLWFFTLSVIAVITTGAVDYVWPLPSFMRALTWLGVFGCGASLGIRWMKSHGQLDEFAAAKAMESAHPELGQRLRTAYQFNSPQQQSTMPQLASALMEDTNERVSLVDFSDTVRWSRLWPHAVGLLTLSVLVVSVLIGWSETRTTLARLLMLPVHYTDLSVDQLAPVVAGSEATSCAKVKGRPLDKVELWTRPTDSPQWTKQPMRPVAKAESSEQLTGELTATIDACDRDLMYKVVGYPVATSSFQLQVLQPLKQQRFAAVVEPPTYTGIDKRTVKEMDLTVVEGSLVSWELQLNREPAEAKLISTGTNKSPPPRLSILGNKLACDVSQLESNQQYEVQATAMDGMKFTSDTIRIRVKQDQGPTVAFKQPRNQIEVTPTTEVGVQLNVVDDFGLSKVGIEYQINGGNKISLWEEDLTGQQKKDLTTLPVMYLEDHQLNYDDAITYYAYAEDNRDQPRRTRSELQFIDIRPYKREYQVVDGQCQGGGACLTLEQLIARQRHNLSRTFANLDRQPIQDRLSQRLATSQTEILTATREFTTGWEMKFGPLPSMHEAATAMEAAATELERKRLDPAMPYEETALAKLIQARQNARRFIKNCSAGQFGQCQKYDNEMAQKLRAPERTDEPAQQNLAEARDKLRKMAEQQRRFSEDIAAGSGGPQLDKEPSPGQKKTAGSSQTAQRSAKAQREAAQAARQVQADLATNDVPSELALQRMSDAADKIEQSAQEMAADAPQEAARRASEAAKLLEGLEQHLKALGSPDLSERLALTEQLAIGLAARENSIASKLEELDSLRDENWETLADQQRDLSKMAETLADQIRHLEADAWGDGPRLHQGIADLKQVHQPEELAHDMADIAREIERQAGDAAGEAQRAATSLDKIAVELGKLRRDILQPQLDQLLQAEAKAAGLFRAIQDEQLPAELVAQYEQLQRELSDLRLPLPSSSKTNQSASRPGSSAAGSRRSAQPGSSQGAGHLNQSSAGSGRAAAAEPQFRYAGKNVNAELRQIIDVLQSKIQDAILLTSRMDADEPVPAKYRDLVNEYFRALSDDLR